MPIMGKGEWYYSGAGGGRDRCSSRLRQVAETHKRSNSRRSGSDAVGTIKPDPTLNNGNRGIRPLTRESEVEGAPRALPLGRR